MKVVLLGTGGYYANERRHTACVLLPECGVVFDAGTAFFRVMQYLARHCLGAGGLGTSELQVFLSHAHLDHICGLTSLLPSLLSGAVRRARVYGTERTLHAVEGRLFSEEIFPVRPAFEFVRLEAGARVDVPGGGVLCHHPLVSHPGGSTAFRIDWPAADEAVPHEAVPHEAAADGAAEAVPRGGEHTTSLAYVTDTAVDGTYTDFVRGVGVLIHECYYPDEQADWAARTGHTHTTPAATLAREAGVGRLVLVHVDPQRVDDDPIGLAAARAIFPEIVLGEDGMEIEA